MEVGPGSGVVVRVSVTGMVTSNVRGTGVMVPSVVVEIPSRVDSSPLGRSTTGVAEGSTRVGTALLGSGSRVRVAADKTASAVGTASCTGGEPVNQNTDRNT